MVNPLTAPTPVAAHRAVARTTRRAGATATRCYLRIEDVPGCDGAAGRRCARAWPTPGRALNAERRIDRDAIFRLKMEALEALFAALPGRRRLRRATPREQGAALTEFATYCALAEHHGKDWRRWPAELPPPRRRRRRALPRRRTRARVALPRLAAVAARRQLARASREIARRPRPADRPRRRGRRRLVLAGPAGARRVGRRAARRVQRRRPGLGPDAVRAPAGCAPPATGRSSRPSARCCAHAGGLRIDHVMGLFRLFWIPRGLGAEGRHLRALRRADELLAIVALESAARQGVHRRRGPGHGRGRRARDGWPSSGCCRTGCCTSSRRRRGEFPELALSSVTTHDLPTIAGLWTGADLEAQKRIGLDPNEDGMRGAARQAARSSASWPTTRRSRTAIEATHRALARAPSRVLLATLDDARRRPRAPQHARHRHRVAQLVARRCRSRWRRSKTAALPRTIGRVLARSG